MKSYVTIFVVFMTLSLYGCGSPKKSLNNSNASLSNSSSSVNTNDASTESKTDSTTPALNPLAKIENGQAHTFKEPTITDYDFTLPSDWEIVGDKGLFISKSPTVESRFMNFVISEGITSGEDSEYSDLEPETAVTRLKDKKEAAGTESKVQLQALDNVSGVWMEKEFKANSSTTESQKTDDRLLWMTFMQRKGKTYEVRFIFSYPSSAKEKDKPIMDGIFNSIRIRRSPDLKMAEFKPQ
jgi:hypothetical protein